jgi:hypothetical protein
MFCQIKRLQTPLMQFLSPEVAERWPKFVDVWRLFQHLIQFFTILQVLSLEYPF